MENQEIKKLSRISRVKNWYGKYERPISSLSLIGGFVFDALTLRRVDLFWENFWVVAHLVIVGSCIILVNALEKTEGDEANPSKTHFWLVNILQFFFGGILSTYLVFYFRSSDIAASWPFLLLLAISFWANEALKRHFVRLIFQISLFYLSVFSFTIFLLPVITHQIGDGTFLLSGAVSVIVIALFLLILSWVSKKEFQQNKETLYACIGGIFIIVNAMYFGNVLPPIPLSLKDAGVYHSLKRNSAGNYVVQAEPEGWQKFVTLYPDYHKGPGEPVFVYSAIFSPPQLDTIIVHEWQYKDPITKEWRVVSRFNLKIVGGRDGGFRTFSEKFNPAAGQWRVNVLTTRGQVIGRIRFNVVYVDEKPVTIEQVND
ncbi:MAG TPA: DUF2914 domain-containing protein [Candidatus Limnocylindria bacterium]|nr:DUF2914 domain-containing protein [Candidatus Limnocylindria bacterium]